MPTRASNQCGEGRCDAGVIQGWQRWCMRVFSNNTRARRESKHQPAAYHRAGWAQCELNVRTTPPPCHAGTGGSWGLAMAAGEPDRAGIERLAQSRLAYEELRAVFDHIDAQRLD